MNRLVSVFSPSRHLMLLVLLLVSAGAAFGFALPEAPGPPVSPISEEEIMMMDGELARAVLAGGCFWGVEAVYEALEGVVDVQSGYSGGSASTAYYNVIGSGLTGHAEAVHVVYDPTVIGFETLLNVFFSVAHDPTQLNRQGPDRGPQYRSAVFYVDEYQQRITEEVIAQLEEDKVYRDPVVTEVVPLEAFYPAENYHQDFMARNPNHPYIVYWDVPKMKHLEEAFPELLADK